MPLYDHFHPPLTKVSQWNSFHHAWLTYQAADLQQFTPPSYYAEPGSRFGIEIDVAALERMNDPYFYGRDRGWEPVSDWTAPAATAVVEFAVATDELEVLVYGDTVEGVRLVGAMEFLSPANKDRPENREVFVSKCHRYLTQGIGVVLVDVVTDKHFNLHNDLMDRVGRPEQHMSGHLYATAYRPTGKDGAGRLEMWLEPLEVGQPLPTVPLWLWGGLQVPARLGDAYEETCRLLRLADRLAPLPAVNGAA